VRAYIVKPFGILAMIDVVDDAVADDRSAVRASGA
jgi:hypothetical protein